MRLTELSGSRDTCTRRICISSYADLTRLPMYAAPGTGRTSGPGQAGIGEYRYIHDCAGATAGRKENNYEYEGN